MTNPEAYLFSVVNADDSLSQATDSALRGVIGKYSMDRILTEGRTVVRNDTQRMLEETIRPYNMGITLLDVNFQAARPPEEVKASFDDAIAARENEQQYIREAEAYANEVQPRANGQAQRLLEDSRLIKTVPSWKRRVRWRALPNCCRNTSPLRRSPASVCISKPWKKCWAIPVRCW